MSRIAVIGSGFSGMSAAAYLAKEGHQVDVFEKNSTPGGRARQLRTENGYVFDMGPSWYWMPDVFERFFSDFGKEVSSYYKLSLLDPGFEIVFQNQETLQIPDSFEQLSALFESIEAGSSSRLSEFMQEAEFKYRTGMDKLVYKPGLSLTEFIDKDIVSGVFRLQVFSSYSKHVRKFFTHPRLIALMEFPVLFLGAMPADTPALYSLMNYAGLKLGTWYPEGGFGAVVDAMLDLNRELGVKFHTDSVVEELLTGNQLITGLKVNGKTLNYDAVIGSSDYHHTESLLPNEFRNYTENYWSKKVFAPSCLIFYLGLTKRIRKIMHHTLFFEEDFAGHAEQIYKDPKWPDKPLFYVCCPSQTDPGLAPEGHENLFLLMPLAPGLEDNEELREEYFHIMMHRLEKHTGEELGSAIDFKRSYCIQDFISDYNSYKGNAYGLANTLTQTAIFKPSIRNKKVKNLFYTGQLTVPGPGVPPALISGKIAAEQLHNYLKNQP